MLTLQLLVNTLVSGALFGAVAASFTIIHRVTKVLHLAHGAVVMVGAYGYLWGIGHGLPIPGAIATAVALATIAGCACSLLVYEPLRRLHHLSTIGNLIASLSLLLILEAALLLAFGARTQSAPPIVPETILAIGTASLTLAQAVLTVSAVGVVALLMVVVHATRLGRAMRAVADHEEVAAIIGINPARIRVETFAIASAIAGFAGTLLAGELAFAPSFSSLLAVKAFSRAIIGGVGSIPGALAGSLLVDFAENLWASVGPIAFREVASLLLFIVVLLVRPWGLFGRKPQ